MGILSGMLVVLGVKFFSKTALSLKNKPNDKNITPIANEKKELSHKAEPSESSASSKMNRVTAWIIQKIDKLR